MPGRSSIYRCLVRHGLITPQARKRKRRSDYKRWERSRAMELWQMDIVGGVVLPTDARPRSSPAIDDHSRFVVSAHVVVRATAQPVCDALALAMRRHGVPDEILTDNGKVFTGRFGPGTGAGALRPHLQGERDHASAHRPRSPTTTGKVERLHKTLRGEFLTGKVFASIDEAQARSMLGAHYNHERPHQPSAWWPPIERFRLAARKPPRPSHPRPQSRPAAPVPPPGG